jgi:hypothetical protein
VLNAGRLCASVFMKAEPPVQKFATLKAYDCKSELSASATLAKQSCEVNSKIPQIFVKRICQWKRTLSMSLSSSV